MSNETACQSDMPLYDGYYKYDLVVAQGYDASREVETHWRHEDQFIENFFRGRQVTSLLDVPVGTGRFFRHYEGVGRVTGVDVSEHMLEEAKKKLPLIRSGTSVQLVRGNVLALQFADRAFEMAVVWRLFHLIPPDLLAEAIKELCRVTCRHIIVQTYAPRARPKHSWCPAIREIASRLSRSIIGSMVRNPQDLIVGKTPWSHIQAYKHEQALIDSLFEENRFSCFCFRVLDIYEGREVRASVYSRE
jgi:ubiquinone/menaquinone biosynthesis C-methylase UbiE